MTHDELLERIEELKLDVGDSGMNEEYKASYALLAVVEQHKPIISNQGYLEIDEEPRFICECDPWDEYDRGYPCPTIQAIEKELK